MPVSRFFVSSALSIEQSLAKIEGEELHHLSRVTRTRVGERVELVDGQGHLAVGHVQSIERHHANIAIESCVLHQAPEVELILIQAIPRLNRLDTLVEKGCELGMDQLWLFPGERSEKKELSEQQKARITHLLVSALKQCGRFYLPQVRFLSPMNAWKSLPEASFFGDLRLEAPLFASAWKSAHQNHLQIAFLVGPEAGLSEEESQKLDSLGAVGVRMHPHILRTDTAPLMALSLMSHWLLTA